jgi:hypothetical protein
VEAIEHANARDCAARKRDASKISTASTLRSGIEEANYLEREAPAASPAVAAGSIATPQSGAVANALPPAAAGAHEPATLSAVPKSVLGWIYLGNQSDDSWQTKYANWKGKERPTKGAIVELVTTSNVRASPPDDHGRLGAIRITLKPRTRLQIEATSDWNHGMVWARVSTPSAQSATPADRPQPAAE